MNELIEKMGYGRSKDAKVFHALLEPIDIPGGENMNEVLTVQFDAVVAEDMERMPLEGGSLPFNSNWWRECRSAVMEIKLTLAQLFNLIGKPINGELYSQWFEISLSKKAPSNKEKIPVQKFMTPDDDPIQEYLESLKMLDSNDPRRKSLSNCLDTLISEEEELIKDRKAINNVEIHAIDVVDVGQGNMNALLTNDTPEKAIIFYDFGAGSYANYKTWPKKPSLPSRDDTKLVVLSHWDFDHWAGVFRLDQKEFDLICNIPWWTPKQLIGINHAKFASILHQNGMLRVIDTKNYLPNLKNLFVCNCSVFGCNGAPSDRNNSGLAMHVRAKDYKTMLLPGDASYDSITDINWWSYAGMVASHHGGITSGRPPAAISPANLAYSYGKGNTYGHPVSWRVSDHNESGWQGHSSTASRGPNQSRGNIRLEFQ